VRLVAAARHAIGGDEVGDIDIDGTLSGTIEVTGERGACTEADRIASPVCCTAARGAPLARAGILSAFDTQYSTVAALHRTRIHAILVVPFLHGGTDMIRTLGLAAAMLAVASAVADEYWVSYQGNDYPENEGWARTFTDGGAIRRLEDGALVLDSLRSVMIVDFYEMSRPIDPDPGELFVMRWRLKVDNVPQREDPSVVAFSDTFTGVAFEFSESYVLSTLEQGVSAPFEPNVYHAFEFTSRDMTTYELAVDGVPTLVGEFRPIGNPSRVAWGDGVQGTASISRWDYFEFGVVPEPGGLVFLACAMIASILRNRHSKRN
jgi:hypothetical protein